MTEDEDEREQQRLQAAALGMELAVLAVLCRRLASLEPGVTYAMARAFQAQDMAEVRRLLEKGRELLAARSGELVDATAEECDMWAAAFYEAAGVTQVAAAENVFTAQTIGAAKAKAAADVAGMCDSTVLHLVCNDGTLRRFDEAYKSIVDDAIRALARGDDTFYELTRKTVERLGKTGLRVQYESGATRDLYSALSQNIMDTARRASAEIREQQGREFGADGVSVSAHAPCAPDHIDYQGREFSNERFAQIQASLRRPIGQWNCRHTTSPVILGVSPERMSAEERAELKAASRRKTGVKDPSGHNMTAYEFTQWQRAREAEVRKLRARHYLNDAAGIDDGLAGAIEEREDAYLKACRAAGIEGKPEQMRVFVLE